MSDLRVRARWRRACRWPIILWSFRCAGLDWRTAWRATHLVIWWEPPTPTTVNRPDDDAA